MMYVFNDSFIQCDNKFKANLGIAEIIIVFIKYYYYIKYYINLNVCERTSVLVKTSALTDMVKSRILHIYLYLRFNINCAAYYSQYIQVTYSGIWHSNYYFYVQWFDILVCIVLIVALKATQLTISKDPEKWSEQYFRKSEVKQSIDKQYYINSYKETLKMSWLAFYLSVFFSIKLVLCFLLKYTLNMLISDLLNCTLETISALLIFK